MYYVGTYTKVPIVEFEKHKTTFHRGERNIIITMLDFKVYD